MHIDLDLSTRIHTIKISFLVINNIEEKILILIKTLFIVEADMAKKLLCKSICSLYIQIYVQKDVENIIMY